MVTSVERRNGRRTFRRFVTELDGFVEDEGEGSFIESSSLVDAPVALVVVDDADETKTIDVDGERNFLLEIAVDDGVDGRNIGISVLGHLFMMMDEGW